ncbi:MAG: hypothetical protein F6K47_19395 [Symploca sp. SIO2E6]|nr:hypothetical protein [Symploca sp. SIO2E6]
MFLKQEKEDGETRGRGDAGTRGRGDAETRRHGDTETRREEFSYMVVNFFIGTAICLQPPASSLRFPSLEGLGVGSASNLQPSASSHLP